MTTAITPPLTNDPNETRIFHEQLCTLINMVLDNNGLIIPITSANDDAPNNRIFYSSDDSKLSYKDSGGTVNGLY